MMNEQLDKTLNYQQNKIDETRKRVDDINVKLYDYATKKELKMLEERINASLDLKIANALKGVSDKMGELKKSMMEDRKELDSDILELKRKIIDLEKHYENKLTAHKNLTDQEIRELDVGTKKSTKSMQEALNRKNEQMAKQIEDNKKVVLNETKQLINSKFTEFSNIIAYIQKKVKEDNAAIKQYAKERAKEQKWIEQRDKELDQERVNLEKKIEKIQEQKDIGIEEEKLNLQNRILEYSKKEKAYEEKLTGISQLQDELMNAMEEVNNRIDALEVSHSQNEIIKERAQKLKEPKKQDSRVLNKEMEGQLAEVYEKIAELEESLNQTKALVKENTKKTETSIKAISRDNENLEQETENIKRRLNKLDKPSEIPEEIENLNSITRELKQSYNKLNTSHEQLNNTVKSLEDHLNGIKADYNKKIRQCNEELEIQEYRIQKLAEAKRTKLLDERPIKVVQAETLKGTYANEHPIILRQGKIQPSLVSKSINENHLRHKFIVNLKDLSRVGQEDSNVPSHTETIDYASIDFKNRKLIEEEGKELPKSNNARIERIYEPFPTYIEENNKEIKDSQVKDDPLNEVNAISVEPSLQENNEEIIDNGESNKEESVNAEEIKIEEEGNSEKNNSLLEEAVCDYIREKDNQIDEYKSETGKQEDSNSKLGSEIFKIEEGKKVENSKENDVSKELGEDYIDDLRREMAESMIPDDSINDSKGNEWFMSKNQENNEDVANEYYIPINY